MKKLASVMKTLVILVISLAIVIAIVESEQEPPDGPLVDNLPPAAQPEQSLPSYALQPLNDSWPALAEGQQSGAPISQDLLAANYYIVIDGSGSMRDMDCSDGRPKMDVAREALAAFAQSLPPAANLGLLAFDNSGISERVPLGANNAVRFGQAVDQIVANRDTPLGSAIGEAYQQLEMQARRQLGYGEYHLVTVTDGKASPGQDPTPVVQQILAHAPVVFHTIGFCIGDQHSLNQPGRTYYQAAKDPAALSKGLRDVLAEAPNFSPTAFATAQP